MRVYADKPGKSDTLGGTDPTAIFTGTRWVILVKLPAALFAGMSENCDAVDRPMLSTLPPISTPG
jgi:hypothetical protein